MVSTSAVSRDTLWSVADCKRLRGNLCDRCSVISVCSIRKAECGIQLLQGILPIGKTSLCVCLHWLPRRCGLKFEKHCVVQSFLVTSSCSSQLTRRELIR